MYQSNQPQPPYTPQEPKRKPKAIVWIAGIIALCAVSAALNHNDKDKPAGGNETATAGQSAEGATTSESAAPSVPTAKPTPSDEEIFARRVRPATTKELKAIAEGVEVHGAKLADKGYAVKTTKYDSVGAGKEADGAFYFIAARLVGPELGKDDVGVWLVYYRNKSDIALIYSADGMAAEFSDWGKSWTTELGAGIDDPDCSNLKDYAAAH